MIFQRKRDMAFSPNVSQDWKMSTLSQGPEDYGRCRIENNQLKLQVKQLTVDLQSEQGMWPYSTPFIWATSWENLFCHMQTTKVQISLRICTVWSAPLLFAA